MNDSNKEIDGQTQTEESASERSAPNDPSTAPGLDLSNMRQQLEAKDLEAKTNYDRFLRQVAESENLKKRLTREKEDAIRFANDSLVRDLLPVIDNLERAISHAQGGGNGKTLVEGVEMVLKGLTDVLAKHGVVQISALGEPFDPNRHEAIAQVETEKYPPNTVVEEFHKGFMLKDRLLRPALVSVAKAPGNKKGNTEVENGPSDD
jgi:molecular chaperone GrpE